jgi:antitoxin component of MazEF toxin-antitoxin module
MNAASLHSDDRYEEATLRLAKHGNSTGLTLPRDTLRAVGLDRGDSVVVTADRETGIITVRKADDIRSRYMAAAKSIITRYSVALQLLAK